MFIQRFLTSLLNPQKGDSNQPPPPILDLCFDGPKNHFEGLQNSTGNYWLNLKVPRTNEKPKASKPLSNNLKVLLVEDNMLNQRITRHVLKKMGLSADVATDGASGVNLVRKVNYDLILMDIHMPVMDGVEATRIIRSESLGGDNVRIIGLTATSIQSDHDSFVKAGMDDVMIKPLDMESLQRKLSSWFQ